MDKQCMNNTSYESKHYKWRHGTRQGKCKHKGRTSIRNAEMGSEMYRDGRVVVAGHCGTRATTTGTARPRCRSVLTMNRSRVHPTATGRHADGRGGPAAADAAGLVAGAKDAFVGVDVWPTFASVDVEARHTQLTWGRDGRRRERRRHGGVRVVVAGSGARRRQGEEVPCAAAVVVVGDVVVSGEIELGASAGCADVELRAVPFAVEAVHRRRRGQPRSIR